MAIQALSMEEVEVVAGGLVVLGLDVGALLTSLLNPVLGIVGTALAIGGNTTASAGTILGSLLTGVNNTIVGLGL